MVFTRQNPPSGYYVYAYLRSDLTPYYIGKGKDKRAWKKQRLEVGKPTNESQIIILKYNLTEDDAFILEKKLIEEHGRIDLGTGILRNKTEGGDGPSGRIISKETCEKISAAKKGNTPWNKGIPRTDEEKLKMSIGRSSKEKDKFSWNLRQPHTTETKSKLKEKALNREKLICPHCIKEVDVSNFSRWHGNNCKNY